MGGAISGGREGSLPERADSTHGHHLSKSYTVPFRNKERLLAKICQILMKVGVKIYVINIIIIYI